VKSDSEPEDGDATRSALGSIRRTLVAGAAAVSASLAGCSGGGDGGTDGDDSDGSSGPGGSDNDDDSGDSSDPGADSDGPAPTTSDGDGFTPLVDAIDGVRFEGGDMFVELKSDEVGFVAVNTPHGTRIGRDAASLSGEADVGGGESSAGPINFVQGSSNDGATYERGTYTVRAYRKRVITDQYGYSEGAEYTEIDRADVEPWPALAVTAVESADTPGRATVTVENTGTGPAWAGVSFGRGGAGPKYQYRNPKTIAPGESAQFTLRAHEYGTNADPEEVCTGETVTRDLTLFLFNRPVTVYTVELALDGEVNQTPGNTTCGEVTGEVVGERTLPEKNF